MADLKSLYVNDTAAWAGQQAAALRAAKRSNSTSLSIGKIWPRRS